MYLLAQTQFCSTEQASNAYLIYEVLAGSGRDQNKINNNVYYLASRDAQIAYIVMV